METPKPKVPTPLNVLIPLFEGFNTLDVNGPLDVICNFALRGMTSDGVFNITTTAKTAGDVKAYEHVSVKADINFDDALKNIKAGMYDVLLVPGSGPLYAQNLVDNKDQILTVISTFYNTDNKQPSGGTAKPKWLISICTGGLICGGAGVFKGINVTTHFGAIDGCRTNCDKANAPALSVTRQRFVDGGLVKPASGQKISTRVLSSGGISCGLDAALFFVSEIFSMDAAWAVAAMMDYNWNITSTRTTPAYPQYM